MLRHENDQDKKIEESQLFSSQSLKKKRALKNGTQSISKQKGIHYLKRILQVYEKEEKHYIDLWSAYSLGLTDKKPMRTSEIHIVEIDEETLQIYQNDPRLEIEYREILDSEIANGKFIIEDVELSHPDVKARDGATQEMMGGDLRKALERLENGEYGIGVHGIFQGTKEEKCDLAKKISMDGLNINNNARTILSTAISLGINEDAQTIGQEITTYRYGNGEKVNVVVAVPLCVQSQNCGKIFLGFPKENKETSAQQYLDHCILDRICSSGRSIPPEFILGYCYENQDGVMSFVENEQHYSNLGLQEREALIERLYAQMDVNSKYLNEAIAKGEISELTRQQEEIKNRGMEMPSLDNAIILTEKYKGQENYPYAGNPLNIDERTENLASTPIATRRQTNYDKL